ncbi:MAG: hypothetical protein KDA24_14925 [Deltaproteobacteria bacterium]|nr:hypothetical protein [Deltaproteobacteria bacterium]
MADESDEIQDARISELASRFIRAGAEAVVNTGGRLRERGEDFKPRDVLAGAAKVAVTGKDEVVTLIAKEVRNYLDKLEIGKEMADFARGHELEVNATFRLKAREPGEPASEGVAGPPAVLDPDEG